MSFQSSSHPRFERDAPPPQKHAMADEPQSETSSNDSYSKDNPMKRHAGSSKNLKEPQIGKLDLSSFAPDHLRQFEEKSARAT